MSRKLSTPNISKTLSSNIVRLCAAGAGKTYDLCSDALSVVRSPAQKKRVLMTTFTNNGVVTINDYIAKQNQGMPSSEITVCTWFQFLLSEFIKPYQTHIVGINEVKSFDFDNKYPRFIVRNGRRINVGSQGQKARYFSGHYNVMSNHASELAFFLNNQSRGLVIDRIAGIYSHVYIDEVQDMAGYDIDLIMQLMASPTSVVCTGDYKQATYRTNTGRKNKAATGKNISSFCEDIAKKKIASVEMRLETKRFNQAICHFANTVFPTDDEMTSIMTCANECDGVFLIKSSDAHVYYEYYRPTVLKYDVNTPTNGWPSHNFGACKGMTFDRVLIFPNGRLKEFIMKSKQLQAPEKYYVGVTRPRHSVAFVLDSFPKSHKQFQATTLLMGDSEIEVMQYVANM